MRRIKNLSLAAFAAMALTAALGAAGASASQLNAESYPTTIGSSNPYGQQAWLFHSTQQHCDAPQLSGSLSGAASKLSASAADGKCYDNFSAGTELKTHGCSFTYRPGAKTESGTFKGTVDIVCPAGQTISFSGGGSLACQVTVPAQQEIPATYENVGVGKERAVKVTVNETSLQHSQVSGSNCGSIGSYGDGAWSGSWKIQGANGFGSVGIWLTGEGFELPPAGIAINGTPPKLVAGTYPISIAGDQNAGGQHVLTLAGWTLKCTTAKLTSSASAATAQFSVTPEYSGCTMSGLSSTVNTNGCTYTFNVLNQPPSGSTYAGHADISCPAGKSIQIVTKSGTGQLVCTFTIGTQTTDSGGLSFTNESSTSTIGLGLSIKGIDHQQVKGEGLAACTSGSYTTGSYTGSSTLVGSY